MKIKSIEKQKNRKDISNYIATLEDGSTVGMEAKTKEEAEKKVKKFIDSDSEK